MNVRQCGVCGNFHGFFETCPMGFPSSDILTSLLHPKPNHKLKCPHCEGTGEAKPLSLGHMFLLHREAKKLTIRDVEKETGISNAVISQIETGKIKNPSFIKMHKLCKFYGIDMNQLQLVGE